MFLWLEVIRERKEKSLGLRSGLDVGLNLDVVGSRIYNGLILLGYIVTFDVKVVTFNNCMMYSIRQVRKRISQHVVFQRQIGIFILITTYCVFRNHYLFPFTVILHFIE